MGQLLVGNICPKPMMEKKGRLCSKWTIEGVDVIRAGGEGDLARRVTRCSRGVSRWKGKRSISQRNGEEGSGLGGTRKVMSVVVTQRKEREHWRNHFLEEEKNSCTFNRDLPGPKKGCGTRRLVGVPV